VAVGSQLKHLYELYNVRPERDLQAEGIKSWAATLGVSVSDGLRAC